MSQEELAENLSKLIQTFNDKRVVSEGRMTETLTAIVSILAENKKSVEFLNSDTKKQLEKALKYFDTNHNAVLKSLQTETSKVKVDIEKSTKQQNERAFKQLQVLLSKVKIPKDGRDGSNGSNGIDGSPDKPTEVRDKLETLKGEERLDASAIKNLPQLIKEKGKQLLVGGIRFFENLADVSIVVTKKRQDLIAQYSTTNNRWENGIALTVSATEPTNPQTGDLWVEIV